MFIAINRDKAFTLLKKHIKQPEHLKHALTVEGVMRWFAYKLGYGSDANLWAVVGLLHDIDIEAYPKEHCKRAPELLKADGIDDRMIRAVCSHGYDIYAGIKPEHEMEKVLFAIEELVAAVSAAVSTYPSKSIWDLKETNAKTFLADKQFASRIALTITERGALFLGWDINKLFDYTVQAMRSCEKEVNQQMAGINRWHFLQQLKKPYPIVVQMAACAAQIMIICRIDYSASLLTVILWSALAFVIPSVTLFFIRLVMGRDSARGLFFLQILSFLLTTPFMAIYAPDTDIGFILLAICPMFVLFGIIPDFIIYLVPTVKKEKEI